MKTRHLLVVGLLLIAAAVFWFATRTQQQQVQAEQQQVLRAEASRLVRMHSPVIGPQAAPVTIVEFFDPACEACRAFYPFVKELLAQHANDVKLVIRYAPFHQGSDQVVKLLESARRQGRYLPVLEALLEAQPRWADHHAPNVALAFEVAERAGLDMARARAELQSPAMDALVQQEVEDLKALQVQKTPTFFVNGRSLPSFGPEALAALVAQEVAAARR